MRSRIRPEPPPGIVKQEAGNAMSRGVEVSDGSTLSEHKHGPAFPSL